MASRPLQTSGDTSAQSSQSNLPPFISPSHKLLSSIISLPGNSSVVYATYVPAPANNSPPEEKIELARRVLVSRNKSAEASILDSLLPCVRVEKELKCLYVFGITSHDRIVESRDRVHGLQFEGLICKCRFSFSVSFAIFMMPWFSLLHGVTASGCSVSTRHPSSAMGWLYTNLKIIRTPCCSAPQRCSWMSFSLYIY